MKRYYQLFHLKRHGVNQQLPESLKTEKEMLSEHHKTTIENIEEIKQTRKVKHERKIYFDKQNAAYKRFENSNRNRLFC